MEMEILDQIIKLHALRRGLKNLPGQKLKNK